MARIRRDGRATSDLPRDLSEVDATRLGRLVGADIRTLEIAGSNSGTTTRARIRVTGADDRLPPSLFLKVAPTERRTRLFVNLMGLGRQEVAFYREVRASVPVAAPRAYAARFDPTLARFSLVLADLEERGWR